MRCFWCLGESTSNPIIDSETNRELCPDCEQPLHPTTEEKRAASEGIRTSLKQMSKAYGLRQTKKRRPRRKKIRV